MFGGSQEEISTSRDQAQKNETSSDIKMATEEWYKTNIVDTGYGKYVADRIFCNDRSTPGIDETKYTNDTGLGYGANATAYGTTARIGGPWNTTKVAPQFMCPQDNDKFTVSIKNGGNGNLTHPVGLLTVDEAVTAGSGKYNSINKSYYLNKNNYWLMTPSHTIKYGSATYVFTIDSSNGYLKNVISSGSQTVNPVINIDSRYLNDFKGTGTKESPFELIERE